MYAEVGQWYSLLDFWLGKESNTYVHVSETVPDRNKPTIITQPVKFGSCAQRHHDFRPGILEETGSKIRTLNSDWIVKFRTTSDPDLSDKIDPSKPQKLKAEVANIRAVPV